MGLDQYDRYFGGTRGAARKTLENMQRTYGAKDGETVFRASIAKRKRKTRSPNPLARRKG